MNLLGTNLSELVGVLVGFALTLAVFSYIFTDNLLFRLAIHIFIGSTAGYAAVLVIYNVLWPQLVTPLLAGNPAERLLAFVPLILSGLLLFKASPRLSNFGNPVIAFLVGTGAAAAIGGAVTGTIFPQVVASINVFETPNLLNATILLLGTVFTLLYFNFGIRSDLSTDTMTRRVMVRVAWVGQLFIAITFGALFAGIYSAAMSALAERIDFLAHLILSFLMPGS